MLQFLAAFSWPQLMGAGASQSVPSSWTVLASDVAHANSISKRYPDHKNSTLSFFLVPASSNDMLFPSFWRSLVRIHVRRERAPDPALVASSGVGQLHFSSSTTVLNIKQFYRMLGVMSAFAQKEPLASASASSSTTAESASAGLSDLSYSVILNSASAPTSATPSGELDECPICLEQLSKSTVVLDCSHRFCEGCIQNWSDKDRSCPICRSMLPQRLDDELWVMTPSGQVSVAPDDSGEIARYFQDVMSSIRRS